LSPGGTVVLAVDIGGTKLAAGLVDAAEGRLLTRVTVPTPRSDDADAVFAALIGLLDELGPDRAAAEACGIGSGGPMTPGGEALTPVHIPAWRGFPLRRRIAEATGLPVFVANDSKAVALARLEFSRGARIRPAGLGGDAPLVGAAAVALYCQGKLPCYR